MNKKNDTMKAGLSNPIVLWALGMIVSLIYVRLLKIGNTSKINILSEYFMYQYDYKELDLLSLMITVLMVRIPVIIIFIIGQGVFWAKKMYFLMSTTCGFFMGYVLNVFVYQYGIRGILISLLLWTPHMFLYLFVSYRLMIINNAGRKEWGILLSTYIIGMMLEIYINPMLLNLLNVLM